MKRVAFVVLGLMLGWVAGTGILMVVSVVLVGMGVPPMEQVIGVFVALGAFIVAGGVIGFWLAGRGRGIPS